MGAIGLKTAVWLLSVATATLPVPAAHAQTAIDPPGASQPRVVATPRIPPLPEDQWTDIHRRLVATFSPTAPPDNALKTLLRLPPLVEAVMPYTNYLRDESTLNARHRELLALRAAWLYGSQVLWSQHAPRARRAGLSAGELRGIAEGAQSAAWNDADRALLRMTDELFRNSSITHATWEAVAASQDLLQMMDAVETINHVAVLSLLYNSLGVQPDAGSPDRLPAGVPYRVVVPERAPPLEKARVEPLPGDTIAVGRTLARHAKLNAARTPRANFINRVSKLEPRHREMLILRMGWNCRSEYEWAQHVGSVGRARDHGLEPVRIAQGADAPGWDPFERAILRAADELYRESVVSDNTWAILAERFDPGMLMSAVFTASSYQATSMALNAFGVQLSPGDERFPSLPSR